jgi:glucosamine-6-phosphate deaminase
MDVRIVPSSEFGSASLQALLEAIAGIAAPVIGLPTGNTPVALYVDLETAVRSGEVDISAWRPFAIDEYGGPRNHPCSNRAFFERYWDTIPGARAVEQFNPEAVDLAGECARMSAALAEAGGLDVSILGIGMNGHLAFNEPGSERNSTVRQVELHHASRASAHACWGEETPTWGLTLGLRELLGARSVLVLANGAAKSVMVARALNDAQSPDWPASLVRTHTRATWVLDMAAASMLSGVQTSPLPARHESGEGVGG